MHVIGSFPFIFYLLSWWALFHAWRTRFVQKNFWIIVDRIRRLGVGVIRLMLKYHVSGEISDLRENKRRFLMLLFALFCDGVSRLFPCHTVANELFFHRRIASDGSSCSKEGLSWSHFAPLFQSICCGRELRHRAY